MANSFETKDTVMHFPEPPPVHKHISRSDSYFSRPVFWTFAGSVFVTMCFFIATYLARRLSIDEWKPTGDGRTIVNTRTGEIRVTTTGERIEDYNKRTLELAIAANEQRTRSRLQQAQQDAQARAAAEEEQRAVWLENGRIYHSVQLTVFNCTESGMESLVAWEKEAWSRIVSPYLTDRFPTKPERDDLSRFIAERMNEGRLRGEKWQVLYRQLQALHFDNPMSGKMTRTAEQVNDSEAARSHVASRAAAELESRRLAAEEKRAAERKNGERDYAESNKRRASVNQQWQSLSPGQTEAQVISNLGKPHRKQPETWTYKYTYAMAPPLYGYSLDDEGIVKFSGGKVTTWTAPKWPAAE